MFNFFKHLNPLAFLISFALGILYCYIRVTPKKIIYRHPTPDNTSKTIYRDEKNKCFKYNPNEVKCNHTALNTPVHI